MKRRRLRQILALLVSATAVLAGCADPGIQPAARPLAVGPAPGSIAATNVASPWPQRQWWRQFADVGLDRLIEQALAGQPTLQVAQARWRQAQAAAQGAGAAQAPQVSIGVDATAQRFSQHGMVSPAFAGDIRLINSAQIQGSWELDLFGRQRNALAAAMGQQQAAEAELQAARTLLAAQVASAYFLLCRYITRPALANERVQTNAAGQVVLKLKTPWRDGTTHLVMSPLEFRSSCSGWQRRCRTL